MAGKSTNQKKVRGRPKMEFVSKKPKIKRDGPGRPKKEIKIENVPQDLKNHKIERDGNNDKRKDAIILSMFIFSLILFTASLYFSQKKQAIVEDTISIPGDEYISETENKIENNTTEIGIETTGSNTQIEETIQEKTPNMILLGNFYEAFNNGSLVNMYPNIDSALVSSKVFKTYFSKMRIQRFLRNISSEGISISETKEDIQQTGKINYVVSYTLKDGHYFEETREMNIINKDIPKIGKIMCISTGCSKLPFFNPGKYNMY